MHVRGRKAPQEQCVERQQQQGCALLPGLLLLLLWKGLLQLLRLVLQEVVWH